MPKLLGGGLIPETRRIGRYLVNDTFTTNRAAGAVNNTAAEPGPGLRVVVDTGNRFSLAGGSVVFGTGGSAGDPGCWYQGLPIGAGRVIIAQITVTANTIRTYIGYDANQSGAFSLRYGFATTTAINILVPGMASSQVLASYTTGSTYGLALSSRALGGAFAFLKKTTTWNLLYHVTISSQAILYPGFAQFSSGDQGIDSIFVPSLVWLPTPTVSDGFAVWGTTDGQGHAEGVSGGLGAGGSGLAWTNQIGTFTAASGVANASALSGGIAIATVEGGNADVVVAVNLTWLAGTGGLVVRYADANNYIQLRYTGTNLQLVKVIANVATTVLDSAATYSAGARIVLTVEATKFRCFYNEAAIGAEQTISDAAVQSATLVGLRTSDTTNTFDNFVVYARGTSGEYSVLDSF